MWFFYAIMSLFVIHSLHFKKTYDISYELDWERMFFFTLSSWKTRSGTRMNESIRVEKFKFGNTQWGILFYESWRSRARVSHDVLLCSFKIFERKDSPPNCALCFAMSVAAETNAQPHRMFVIKTKDTVNQTVLQTTVCAPTMDRGLFEGHSVIGSRPLHSASRRIYSRHEIPSWPLGLRTCLSQTWSTVPARVAKRTPTSLEIRPWW